MGVGGGVFFEVGGGNPLALLEAFEQDGFEAIPQQHLHPQPVGSLVRHHRICPSCIARGGARFGRNLLAWKVVRPCGGGR
jgi:hypothetical protein